MVKTRPRVAVVDDDESVRKALQRLLRASDFDADTYASAQDFLASLPHATPPDCLVLDLQMPGTSGLDLQQQIVRAGLRLPIVLITGHDGPGMQARCLAAGASAYLRKPLEAGTLLAAFEAAIDPRSLRPCKRPALQSAGAPDASRQGCWTKVQLRPPAQSMTVTIRPADPRR